MGIAHRYESALEGAAVNRDGIVKGAATILGKLLRVLQDGGSHIHRDTLHLVLCVEMQLQDFDARERLETDGILMGHTLVVQELRHASGTIATHHRLRTVVVEDAHGEIGIGTGGSTDEDESVAANAEVRTAPLDGCLRRVGDMIS